jgi:hypothetical protein
LVAAAATSISEENGFDVAPDQKCRRSTIIASADASDSSGAVVGYLSSFDLTQRSLNRRQQGKQTSRIVASSSSGVGGVSSSSSSDTTGSNKDDGDDNITVDTNCPTWLIVALSGQRIRLTMEAFGGGSTGRSHFDDHSPETDEEVSKLVASVRSNVCYEFGTVGGERPSKSAGKIVLSFSCLTAKINVL